MTRTWGKEKVHCEGEKRGKIIEEETTACIKRKRKSIVKEKRRRKEGGEIKLKGRQRQSVPRQGQKAVMHTLRRPLIILIRCLKSFFVQYIWFCRKLYQIFAAKKAKSLAI